ncbi:MAG: hypothetical protein WC974_09550 [Thermoplasmata archaeon]
MTDIYSKILLTLNNNSDTGDFTDLTEKLTDINFNNIKSACMTLEKENKIEMKRLGEYAISFGDGSYINTRKNKVFARLKPNGLRYVKEVISPNQEEKVNIKADNLHIGNNFGDYSISSSKIINPDKPTTTKASKIIKWVFAVIAFISAIATIYKIFF